MKSLERELQLIRMTASATLETTSKESKPRKRHQLGYEEEVFRFEHAPSTLQFGPGSAASGDISRAQEFISACFP